MTLGTFQGDPVGTQHRLEAVVARHRYFGRATAAPVSWSKLLVGELHLRGPHVVFRCATEVVPGIGGITGERRHSQASASCEGLAWGSPSRTLACRRLTQFYGVGGGCVGCGGGAAVAEEEGEDHADQGGRSGEQEDVRVDLGLDFHAELAPERD